MRQHLVPLLAPTIAMAILTLGNGFFTTLTTVALNHQGITEFLIGVVSAMYFLGMAVGSVYCNPLIVRVGHIRAFATFASVMAVVTMLQGLWLNPYCWLVLRFITGYCLAGLFIVIEGWVVQASDRKLRGVILAMYLLTYYLSQGLSQLFLKIEFSQMIYDYIVIVMLVTIAIVPVSVTKFSAPTPHKPKFSSPKLLLRKAPTAVAGGFAAGLILGALYTIYPLYLVQAHYDRDAIATLMLCVIVGGAIWQYPVGWVSDRIDRRVIMVLMCGLTLLISLMLLLFEHTFWLVALMSFLLGGATFTIYPLSINNASDNLPRKMSVSIIAIMTALYGLGTFLGPLLTTFVMEFLGHHGFFMVLAVIAIVTALYSIFRIVKKDVRPRRHFVPTMRGKPVDPVELVDSK